MKVSWFHLMPYGHLPNDFRQKYRSVWVDAPNDLYDPKKGNRLYNDYLDELEFAETVGFDGLCVNEHHSNAYGTMPSPNLMAAALARRTSKAALIVLGNSIALYNPPIRVAEEFAMLDVLSGGRLVAGFPVGSSMDTTFVYGQIPATLRDKYREAHDLIIQSWTRRGPFAFNGKYTQLRYVNIWPRPLQDPHPPIWIPAGGSVETWDWCLDNDYCYCYLSYFGYKRARELIKGFWDELERRGMEANPYRAGFLQLIAVGSTDAEAERVYKPYVDYFFNCCLHIYRGFTDAPGYRTLETLRRGFKDQLGRPATQVQANVSWKELVEQGAIIGGSPSTVREQLAEALEQMRIGQLLVLCQFGNMPPDVTRLNTELFAQEVMPYVHDMWRDYEDRWWPQPLVQRATPAPLAASR